MAGLCEHYHISPVALRDATMEEINALLRRADQTAEAVKAHADAGR